MTNGTSWFLHVDLDAFFASVEQLDHPEYRGKPVIVGGKPEDKRGVVSTASYEARKYGVHSAMPTYQAYKLCPNGIYVHGRMERYSEISYKIMNIFKDYSPDVDQMSIDEAFIDITGTENLFGPPEETALKIKKQVKEYTGLTVSIGLATNKYLAKIASAMSKPDGFYFIKPGTEQSFMLNLPLEKVWGVGKKTLETIKKSGIRTTREIYEKPLNVLQFMYGNNMGNFLYNVVRGIDVVGFGKKSKNHSISSESTFIEDITDEYTLETKLLELCHCIIFRLLKENSYSRTAFVKIRYEDFTTVSIQKTVDFNILTLDSFFSLIKELFHEKYDHKTGIRLLGVGLDKLEKNPLPEQLYLFEENSKKKQTVEKAILSLEQKHPEIKIHKARLLINEIKKTTKLVLLFGLLLFNIKTLEAQNINVTDSKGGAGLYPDTINISTEVKNSQENTKVTNSKQESTPVSNDFTIPNKSLNFDLSGYWIGEFTQTVNSSFGNGNPFVISTGTPIFKQEIDFSALINITDHWLFNIDFADKFSKNTFALSYENDANFNSFLLSNRNIIFPHYSVDLTQYSLSGGENQAPGVKFHFKDKEKEKWQADFLLRYDLLNSKEATFYGNNIANDFYIPISNFIKGKIYVLPSKESLLNIDSIYIENGNGSLFDTNKHKYSKISSSDYKIISSKNLIIFSSDVINNSNINNPKLLVTFKHESDFSNLIYEIGDYSKQDSYLGKIQDYFNQNANYEIQLNDYTAPLITQIENKNALFIQNDWGFSPFVYSCIYDFGIVKNGEANLVYKSSEIINFNFEIHTDTEFFDFTKENFFMENHFYAELSQTNSTQNNTLSPEIMFPFGNIHPEIYFQKEDNLDLYIRFRNYSSVANYDIGKKASGETVHAYINGIQDMGAKYDNNSGFVILSKPVNYNDKIYITWKEESSNIDDGSLALAAGYKYNFTNELNSDISLTSRFPISISEKYATDNNSKEGFSAVTGGINYNHNNLSISDALSLSITNDNFTGYKVLNSNIGKKTETYYQNYSNAYKTLATPSLNIANAPELSQNFQGTVFPFEATTDSNITGYKLPLNWDFTELSQTESNWASIDIKLNAGELLNNSSELNIALKPEQPMENIDVYLQLGIKAEKYFSGENSSIIPTWKLNGYEDSQVYSKLDLQNTNWQIIKIGLSNSDRAKIQSTSDLRLIITSKDSSFTKTGKLSIGPYEPVLRGTKISHHPDILVFSSTDDISESHFISEKKVKNAFGNHLTWKNLNTNLSSKDYIFNSSQYFESSSFSNYKYVNFDFFISGEFLENEDSGEYEGLIFILDTENDSDAEVNQTALKIHLYPDLVKSLITEHGNWYKLSINKDDFSVLINDKKIDKNLYKLIINPFTTPSRFSFAFNTLLNNNFYSSGDLIIGNIYYEQNSSDINTENNINLTYKNEKWTFLENISIDLDSNQRAKFNFESANNNLFEINGNMKTDFSIWNFDFSSILSVITGTTINPSDFLSQASHKIKTNTPILKVFSISEDYLYNPLNKEINKADSINLNFSELKVPVNLKLLAELQSDIFSTQQNLSSQINYSQNINNYNITLSSDISLNQKTKNTNISQNPNNYFTDYFNTSIMQFTTSFDSSKQRNETLNLALNLKIPYFDLNPNFKINFSGKSNDSNLTSFKENTDFIFNMPFKINKNKFAITYTKSGENISTNSNTNYFQDINQIFSSQDKISWLFTTIPLYDLFDQSLLTKLSNIDSFSINNNYFSKYDLSWHRELFNSKLDFFLPISTNISIARNISLSDTNSDIYQIKFTLGNTFINMLANKGQFKIFKNFNSDEFMSYLTGAIKIPSNNFDEIKYQLSWYASLLLFKDSQNSIKTGADLSLETNFDWKARITTIWSHSGNDSILLKIPEFIVPNFIIENKKILRKENFNISLSQTDFKPSELFQYLHNCDINFNNNYTLSTGIGLNLQFTKDTATKLGTEFSIGGKIEF